MEIGAGAATLLVDELTRRESAPATEPIPTQFSLERAVLVALAYGDLTPATVERAVPSVPPIWIRHEPAFTRDTVASIERRRHPGQPGTPPGEIDALIAAKGAAYTQAA